MLPVYIIVILRVRIPTIIITLTGRYTRLRGVVTYIMFIFIYYNNVTWYVLFTFFFFYEFLYYDYYYNFSFVCMCAYICYWLCSVFVSILLYIDHGLFIWQECIETFSFSSAHASPLCHHFSRSHPFLHIVTEHCADVYQYEQHARDA